MTRDKDLEKALLNRAGVRPMAQDAEWEEGKHPRAENGQFGHHGTLTKHGWTSKVPGIYGKEGTKNMVMSGEHAGTDHWSHHRAQTGPTGRYNGMHESGPQGQGAESLEKLLASGEAEKHAPPKDRGKRGLTPQQHEHEDKPGKSNVQFTGKRPASLGGGAAHAPTTASQPDSGPQFNSAAQARAHEHLIGQGFEHWGETQPVYRGSENINKGSHSYGKNVHEGASRHTVHVRPNGDFVYSGRMETKGSGLPALQRATARHASPDSEKNFTPEAQARLIAEARERGRQQDLRGGLKGKPVIKQSYNAEGNLQYHHENGEAVPRSIAEHLVNSGTHQYGPRPPIPKK